MLPLKISWSKANAVHPAVILLLISFSCFFVSDDLSLSHVNVAFDVLDQSVVDIMVCHFSSSPLSLTCSSSNLDCHFHQQIPVAFVVVLVVPNAYEYVVGEAQMTKIFAVYLQVSGFPSQ